MRKLNRWLLFFIAVVSGILFLVQPLIEPWEIEAAERFFGEFPEPDCRRTPLHGEGTSGAGTEALRTLLDRDGPWGPCLTWEDTAYRMVREGELGGDLTYRSLRTIENEPHHEGWTPIERPAPPYPAGLVPHTLRDIERVCAGLPQAIEAVIAHQAVCAPWGPDEWEFDMYRHPEQMALTFGLITLAFRHAYEGHGAEALFWLLDGARLAQDIGRGHPTMVATTTSETMLDALHGAITTLLSSELHLTEGEIAELDRRLVMLAASHPHPIDALRADNAFVAQGAMERRAVTAEEAPLWTVFQVAQGDTQNCGPSATAIACLRAMADDIAQWEPSPWERRLGTWIEHPITRRYHLGPDLQDAVRAHLDVARQRFRRPLSFAALRVVLAFHSARRTTPCPDPSAIPEQLLEVPQTDARFSLLPDAGRGYELTAPASTLALGTGELPLASLPCGATPIQNAGAFFLHGERVEGEALSERNAGLPEAMRLGPLAPDEEVALPANQ